MYFVLTIFAYFAIFLAALSGIVYIYFVFVYGYWTRKGVETIEPTVPFGNIGLMLRGLQPMNVCISELYKKAKGPYTGIFMLNKPALLIRDPELVKTILIKDFSVFQDRGMYCDEEKEPLSGHLFRLNGPRWRLMRNKLSPSFSIGKLKMMFETMVETGKQLESKLEMITEKGEIVNITEHSVRYSSDVIASVIFGLEVNSFRDPENKWWQIVKTLITNITYLRSLIFMFVMFTPEFLRILGLPSLFHKSNEEVFAMVKEVVDYREENKVTRNDFMQLLIQLKNKGEIQTDDNVKNTSVYDKNTSLQGLTMEEVSAQAYTMFFAGFETSATTISYTMYMLAKHPDIQHVVQQEIDRCLAKHDGKLTYEALSEMTYLDCVICETLRIYPVLGFLNRKGNRDYTIPDSGVVLKKGLSVFVSVLGMQNDPIYFPNPEKFDPDRFSAENKPNIRSCTYMPFGEGPRNCIGKKFGQLQTAVGVVMIMKKHTVSLAKGAKPIKFHNLAFPYIPTEPIALKVSKRSN